MSVSVGSIFSFHIYIYIYNRLFLSYTSCICFFFYYTPKQCMRVVYYYYYLFYAYTKVLFQRRYITNVHYEINKYKFSYFLIKKV
jgi:hypothetical protein